MARKGVKVKQLAQELGITSRDLINRCRAEGITVQNSITRLSPQLEATVREWFAEHGGSPVRTDPTVSDEPSA